LQVREATVERSTSDIALKVGAHEGGQACTLEAMLHGRVEGAQVLAHQTVKGLLFRPARSVGIASLSSHDIGRGFPATALAIALGSGVLLWLLGRSAAHMGMSGVVFGFFGYLVARAYFTRNVTDVLIAGGVLVLYGSMLAGIKPARNNTSWEGHLFGLLAGIATAWTQLRGFR
jgi:hypothetical protein